MGHTNATSLSGSSFQLQFSFFPIHGLDSVLAKAALPVGPKNFGYSLAPSPSLGLNLAFRLGALWQQPLASITLGKTVAASTTATAQLLEKIRFVDEHLKTSVYNHDTKVDIPKGRFEFDCSGLVNWLLKQVAPTAYAELKSDRPRVLEYAKTLKAIAYDKPSAGWRRIQKIADAEPGDVIAWPTPDWYPSDATGHMGIVYAKPEKVSGGYLVRIADATSYPHGEDSREGGTGFGYGTIFIAVDPDTGEGKGQGWTGRYSTNTILKTPIYVGRPLQ